MEDDICRTVYADADIVWDYNEFVNKYDKKHDTVCFELQQVYAQFDNGIKHLLTVIEYTDSLYEKDKMKWLLSHLAGRGVVEMPKDLPEQLVSQIKMLLRKIAAEHSDVAEAYKNLVIEHVKNRVFVRKKFQIEGIIVNLLSLLDWLRQRKIAMRDIKPDNLLIAGDLDDQPLLLASPDEYSIGLIDLETAVILANEANETRQPMLGGTPLYATPSHFFTNELLQDVYKDVATVLMLQDWFAAVGIIYELVTGEKLFFKTANKLHGIVRKLRSTDDRERCVPQLYWNINRYFWRFAKMEFAHNLEQTKAVLDAAQVKVPDGVKGWLEQFLIPTGAGDHGQSKAVALPQNGSSKSPVYALLTVMFEVVMNNMVAAAPDKIEAGVAKADADMREASPADAAAEPQVLGFTFTV
jgi:serine/threonine protein kinase